MAYDFAENEYEPEALAAPARGGRPPRKFTGIDVVDSPFPPQRPVGPIHSIQIPRWLRGFTGLLLFAIFLAMLLFFFSRYR
ncbi:MAG TPA: hypothetical protein VJO16_04610 [Candidatus Acidoferrum sp.]|nr:hypothetical protein [Candidatus Acidoferrum sp.]